MELVFRYLSLIGKNSLRNRRRSSLTVASIAGSLCLLGLLMALYHSFYLSEASAEQAMRLVTRNKVSLANPLPLSYQQKIAQVPGVEDVMIYQWFGGTYKDARDPKNFFGRFTVDPEKLFTVYPDYRVPEDQKKAFLAERTACVIGRKTADRLGIRLGDRLTIVGDIFPMTAELVVRAIYDNERDNENLFFHHAYLKESMKQQARVPFGDMVGTFIVRAERAEDVGRIAGVVDEMFRNSPYQTKTESEKAFELSFIGFLGNVKLFLLGISTAVTFTILLVSGNTMAMSVRERVREVGILKTLGFTPAGILGVIVGESILISLAGGVIGLALASGVCAMIRGMPSTFADMSRIAIQPSVAAACLLMAIFIGVASSAVSAWSAAHRSIAESLRFTD